MKYKLENLRMFTGRNTYNGVPTTYNWIQADLFIEEDVFANPDRLPSYYILNSKLVELYKPYLNVPDPQRPDTFTFNETLYASDRADATKNVPDLLHVSQIHRVKLPLPGTYARTYKADVINPTTKLVEHKAGEFVKNKQGEITPVTSIVLHIKKRFDAETGEYEWVEEPESVMLRVIGTSYKKYVDPTKPELAPSAPTPEEQAEAQADAQELAQMRAQMGL